jgi:drug/metabolite transporter (DMT)-like permease
MMTDRRAYILLFVVTLVWAGNYPLSKLALERLGPITMTAARAFVATPLLWWMARMMAPRRRPFSGRDYAAFIVLGLTGLVGNTTIWYWGLAGTTALNAGILGASSPIFVAVAAALFLGDRLHPWNYVGIVLSVAAVVVTVAKGSLGVLLTLSVNHGDFIILLSQVGWVTYSLYSRRTTSTLPPAWILTGAHVVSAIVLVPLAVIVEWPWPSPVDAPFAWGVMMYGVFPVTLGHLWYYAIVRSIGPGRAAAFLNLMPFVVLGLSWLIIGEPVRAYHLAGAALVIGGVYLATRRAP